MPEMFMISAVRIKSGMASVVNPLSPEKVRWTRTSGVWRKVLSSTTIEENPIA